MTALPGVIYTRINDRLVQIGDIWNYKDKKGWDVTVFVTGFGFDPFDNSFDVKIINMQTGLRGIIMFSQDGVYTLLARVEK